ncbi:hypothetical protein HYV57_03485 [Candidatus Peregrinibacteria bacterium]|nr:hypothetical protein [Candidatus Peregrinibacteria bacterium]
MMQKRLKKISICLIAFIILIKETITYAAGYKIPPDLTPNNVPFIEDYIPDKINNFLYALIGGLMVISVSLAIFFIFQGGFSYIISRGSDDATGKAKKGITWAILGLLLIIFAYQVVKVVLDLGFTPDPTSP